MACFSRGATAFIFCVSLLTLSACASKDQEAMEAPLPPPSTESWQLLPPKSDNLNDRINVHPQPAHQPVLSQAELSKRLRTLEGEVADIKARMGVAADAMSADVQPMPIKVAPVAQAKPAPKAVPKAVAKAPDPKVTGKAALNGLRFAVEKGVTKVIIDTGVSVTAKTDLDNTEKLLIVELKGIKPGSVTSGKGKGMVSSYTVQNTNDGSRIIYQLNGTSRILKMGKLPPAAAYGYRTLIDLAPGA